jgi:pimeloyl-ACP methyl ester carboxylesterase
MVFVLAAPTCWSAEGPGEIPAVTAEPPAQRLVLGEHYAPLPDVTLWYRVAGRGPLLVVTSVPWGIGSAYLQAPGALAPLERHFRVIYVNTRGSYPSRWPKDIARMGTSDCVEDLEHLRQYWGLSSLTLLGHSAGGGLVLGYAEQYPRRAARVVLVDSDLTDRIPSAHTDELVQSWIGDPRYHAAAQQWLYKEQHYPDTDEGETQSLIDILDLYFHDPGRYRPEFERTVSGIRISRSVFQAFWKAEDANALPESRLLGQVLAKTLIIAGKFDFICPMDMQQVLAGGIHGSKLIVFERSGHIPWIEERSRFFRVVARFLLAR